MIRRLVLLSSRGRRGGRPSADIEALNGKGVHDYHPTNLVWRRSLGGETSSCPPAGSAAAFFRARLTVYCASLASSPEQQPSAEEQVECANKQNRNRDSEERQDQTRNQGE